jgi:hypothetical protein
MKKLIPILTLCLLAKTLLFGQFKEGEIQTDSSIIKTNYYEYLNSIRIFNEIKGKNLTYYEEYFMDTKTLTTKGIFKSGWCSGIWKVYNKSGELTDIRNYDTGEWEVLNKEIYPNYDLQISVLQNAFEFIRQHYGKEFTDKHVKFNLNHSYKRTERTSKNWCEPLNEAVMRFSLSFDINIAGMGDYERMIKFDLNNNGQLLPIEYYKDVQGFQSLTSKNFKFISKEEAIQKLVANNKIENSKNPTFATLRWIYNEPNELKLNNGMFVYSLLYLRGESNEARGERTTITSKFDSYNFNFWTGEFIDITKMKSVRGWGKESGFSTGLIPDN